MGGADRVGLCLVCAGTGVQQQVPSHISYTLDCRLDSVVCTWMCPILVVMEMQETSTVHKHTKYIKQDIFICSVGLCVLCICVFYVFACFMYLCVDVDGRIILRWIFRKLKGSWGRDGVGSGQGRVAGTCGYGEGLSGSINAGNFLTSCKVYWLASQEGLCSME